MCNFCNFSQVHIFPFIVHFASTLLCSFNIFTNIHANLKNKIIKSSFSLFFYYYFLFYLILFFFILFCLRPKPTSLFAFTLCFSYIFICMFFVSFFISIASRTKAKISKQKFNKSFFF